MIGEWTLLLAVMFAAAVIQGATGFGFGLVCVAVLSLSLPIHQAAGLTALPALTINLLILWQLRRHLHLKDVWGMGVAIAAAAPVGVAGYCLLDARVMNGVLALVLTAALLQPFVGRLARRPWHPFWLGVPLGLLSGLLSGAYGTGGPPAVAYVQSRHYERHRHVVGIQFLLAIGGVFRVFSLLLNRALDAAQWQRNMIGACVVPLGVWAGLRLLRRMPGVWLRRAVLLLLALAWVHSIMRSLG